MDICLLAAGLLAIAASSVAVATEDNYLDLSLEELLKVKITSSTLHEETLQTVPSAMTVYSRQEIRALGITSLEQLMNYVPGCQSARGDDSSLASVYSCRGRRLGTSGREVLILIDGKRLNNDSFGGAETFNPLMSLDNVERVEFIRGPGSAIYGSNAIMGVINIITHSGKEVDVQAGDHAQYQAALQWRFEDAARSLELFAKQGRDPGQALAIFDSDAAAQHEIASRDPYQNSEIYMRGHWGEFSANARWVSRSSQQFYAIGLVDNTNNQFDSENSYLNLTWKHPFDDHLSLQADLNDSDGMIKIVTTFNEANPRFGLDPGYIKEHELGTSLLLRGDYDDTRWLLGWEFRQPDLYNSNFTISSPSPLPFFNRTFSDVMTGTRTIAGYFGQYQLALTDKTSLVAGLRLDDYTGFGSHLSRRLDLTHQLNQRDTLKFLYSTSFRVPTRIEADTAADPLAGVPSNPNLVPEVATNYEMVWLHVLDKGQFSASMYYTDVKNAIENIAAPPPSVFRAWVNAHEIVAGLELEWQQKLTDAWSTRVALTETPHPATYVDSEAAALLGASLVYQQGAWLGSVRANYQGARRQAIVTAGDMQSFIPIGGRTVFGAHMAYQLNRQFELYGTAENILNRQYVAPAQSYTNLQGVPERGRTAVVGIRGTF